MVKDFRNALMNVDHAVLCLFMVEHAMIAFAKKMQRMKGSAGRLPHTIHLTFTNIHSKVIFNLDR